MFFRNYTQSLKERKREQDDNSGATEIILIEFVNAGFDTGEQHLFTMLFFLFVYIYRFVHFQFHQKSRNTCGTNINRFFV